VAVGLGTYLLARSLGRRRTETLLVAGLLHDVGTLLLCTGRPREARDVLVQTENRGLPHHVVELGLLGFTHADVGSALLGSWSLGPLACDVAKFHHEPLRAPSASADAVDLVHVADVVASALSMGNAGERAAHALEPEVWRRTGLTTQRLERVVRDLDAQILEVVEVLVGK
jgi:HD-like signal output (HDOD) protein